MAWGFAGFATLDGLAPMVAAIQIEILFAVLVVLNLVGLSIAAYFVMRKK